jgi:hypothetical protein
VVEVQQRRLQQRVAAVLVGLRVAHATQRQSRGAYALLILAALHLLHSSATSALKLDLLLLLLLLLILASINRSAW